MWLIDGVRSYNQLYKEILCLKNILCLIHRASIGAGGFRQMSFLGSASKCLEYLELFQMSACFTSYSFRSNLPAQLMKDSCLEHPVSLKTWGISALHNKLEFRNEFILPFGLHTHTKKTAFMTQRVIKQTFVGCIRFTPWVGAAGRCNTPAATLSLSALCIWSLIFFPFNLAKNC